MTLIKQEKLVFILVILYIRVYLFLQNCLRVPGYPKISNFGYPVPEKTENTQPFVYRCINNRHYYQWCIYRFKYPQPYKKWFVWPWVAGTNHFSRASGKRWTVRPRTLCMHALPTETIFIKRVSSSDVPLKVEGPFVNYGIHFFGNATEYKNQGWVREFSFISCFCSIKHVWTTSYHSTLPTPASISLVESHPLLS